MKEILLLNPRRKGKTTTRKRTTKRRTVRKKRTARRKPVARRVATKGATKMAKTRKKAVSRKRRAPRRNPSRARRATRRVASMASGSLAGLNIKTALKGIPLNVLGMFASKWAAKRFGEAASETDPGSWNYASYLKGALGAVGAGFVANMIKRGSGQKVLEGGMSLMLYKLVQNELIAGSSFWSGQLGATNRVPGAVETNSEGEPFILGEDYQWYPLEGADDYRMLPESGMYGEALTTPGPLGDALTAPGPLGSTIDERYAAAFLNR